MVRFRLVCLWSIFLISFNAVTVSAFELDTPLAGAPISYLGAVNYQYTGWSLSAGDVDGDGINDLLIGGKTVYLILGKNIGQKTGATIADVADASFIGENSGDDFGDSVSMTGDVNNDGFDDILIGANRYASTTGKTYLILGKASGWAMNTAILDIAEATFDGENTDDWSSFTLAFTGDINGDGFDDFLIGAYRADIDTQANVGKTYLFLGKAAGWQGDFNVTDADATLIGEPNRPLSARALAAAGDVNHDGLDDFLISARNQEIYLFFGKTSGWSGDISLGSADASFVEEIQGDGTGYAVTSAGDVNNDGFDDILIGTENIDAHGHNAGKAYLILGKADGWAKGVSLAAADASFYGENEDDHLGVAVSSAGDVNNDGFDDFLIGSTWINQYTGKAYLIFGKAAGWALDTPVASVDASFLGEATYDYAGFSMTPAGDINKDGNDDFLISAAYFGSTYTGKVYFYYGDGPVRGDFNADRETNLDDVIIGLKVLGTLTPPYVFNPGNDVNGDGALGLEDILYDLQKTSELR